MKNTVTIEQNVQTLHNDLFKVEKSLNNITTITIPIHSCISVYSDE